VSVIVERKSFHDKPGLADSWSVVGVIGGNDNGGETESTLIREDDGIWQYLYGGFDIEFAVPCREGDRVSMEDEPHSFLRHWSNCKQMSREGELDSSGQTPAEDQVVGNDDQCGDIKTSPNDARIAQTEEETDKTASNGARDSEGVKPG